uniref:Uncharacterized protein n=1 Tax=Myotis myotis TaxID=51298 RepID=A0A7J7QWK9_MYOMY|nr:hypothetical protein mMyoMyo1_011293 [Myotis myotis]
MVALGHGASQDQAEGPGPTSCPGHHSAAPAGHNGAPSKAPDANAVPLPNCIPTPRPSWSTQTEPQKAEITLDTGPEPEEHVYCPRRLILLRGLGHTRCQLSAGSRRRHAHRQEGPPRGPPEARLALETRACAKWRLGVCTCSEGPLPRPTALHLPLGPPRSAESELALTHIPSVSTPSERAGHPDGSLVPETQKLPEQSYELVAAALLIVNKY